MVADSGDTKVDSVLREEVASFRSGRMHRGREPEMNHLVARGILRSAGSAATVPASTTLTIANLG